ncbi:Uncharacterised protein [Streptococcus criceti]|uniref:Lipoprotein n=1 Tax=Streptococcus criceti HS-6 TaxID=873449 RepID=G5JRM2_STRCG|nr:hypothetical protein [Streptococcus criceti]EHI73652.1 putative lipoprotein [Streptococcus criceti HS-6]SUN42886.1 Uncharacterised protein [Streptococcus criceti]
MTFKKIIKLLTVVFVSIFLVSCGLLNVSKTHKNNQTKMSSKLTVTKIHDSIIRNKTTEQDLVNQFGNPDEKVMDSSRAEELYYNDNDNEGGTLDRLDDKTDYFDTEKYVKENYDDGNRFSSCYIYRGNKLGVEYVRFFIKDGLVRNYTYGDIIDKTAAKKDKYLRQIID